MLETRPELQVIGRVSDGLEAVHKAEELRPDLIVLDIGLPSLNGIDAARQIRELSPNSKILFLSQETSADLVQEALGLGALGYVVKTHAGTELLVAVEVVCQGRQFVSSGLSSHHFTDAKHAHTEIARNHEVQFYSDDGSFLVGLVRFVEAALEAGNMVVVFATESHRKSLLQTLQVHGVDVAAAIGQGLYIPLDTIETLANFMEAAGPNRKRFLSIFEPIMSHAENEHKRVAVFGEAVGILCAEGRMKAAIELEQLWNELAQTHSFYLRHAYPMIEELKEEPYATICAQHSAVLPAEHVISSTWSE
jgi:CheY-like chemotaxis protein